MASFAFFRKDCTSADSVCINIDQISYFTESPQSRGEGVTRIYFTFPDEQAGDGRPWSIDVMGNVNATERQIMKVHKRFGNNLNLTREPIDADI